MKLKSILKTLSTEHLRGIEQHWGIAPADLSATSNDEARKDLLINNLYQRMQHPAAWDHASRELATEDRNLIHFLTIHGGDLEAGEVCRRFFGGDKARMEKQVSALALRGLVFFDNVPGLSAPLRLAGVPEPFLRYIDLPSFWEGYLGHFLKEMSNNELKHVATQGLRLAPESANKNYLIHLIRSALLDPKFLRRYIERLTEPQRTAFQGLVETKGVCVYRDLLELNVPRRYDHSRGDAIQWLLQSSGLVFTAVPGGNKYNNLLMIPRDVMYILQNHYEPDNRTFAQLDSVTLVEKEKKPSVILDHSNTLLRDIVVFVNVIDRHPVRVMATEGISRNDLKKVQPMLAAHNSVKYCEFLALFLIENKFLVSTGETYRASHDFLDWIKDSQKAYTDILTWWLKTADWNEEFVDGNVAHTEPAVTGLVPIAGMRRLVIDALRDMPHDRWCVESGFYEEVLPRIRQEVPRRGDPLAYDKHTRSNELVVESLVAESLCWLGILAIGVGSEEDVELIGTRLGDGKTLKARGGSRGRPRKQKALHYTFRFTELGRFVFSRPVDAWERLFEPLDPNEFMPLKFDVTSFIVQPTHEVVVPPDLDLRTFFHLNEIGTVKSIDVMSILAITRESLREGLDRGFEGPAILDFLTKHSRTPLPETLKALIRECSEKHGEVNMGFAGGYILIDDTALLGQVTTNRKIAGSIKRVLDDRLVILHRDADVNKLSRELAKIGFLPRLESEHVHVTEDDLYNISLSREDLIKLIAALRFTMNARDEKGRDVATDRLGPLLERLKTDPRSFGVLNEQAEPLIRLWSKAVDGAVEARIAEKEREFENKLSHLVSNSVPRGTSKYNFDGPNPAEKLPDVRLMIDFAIENEFEVEIDYVKATHEKVTELIAPESLERDRLYAHCRTRDAYSVYRMDRIQQARLV